MSELVKAGKYEILAKVGEGGFGIVYKGRDPFLKRLVAIKTCEAEDPDLRRRFFREAEIAGQLQHPNITTVHDFGFQDKTPYLVQEYLSGKDLDHTIKDRIGLDLETKLRYLIDIAHGLAHAHSQGVTHRDVKPGNIRVLENGRVKIMDFGIAKLANAESQLTQAGTALGTPAYLAPEQIKGEEVDQRADIYSWGVLAFELLSYERPFDARTISSLFYQKLHGEPRPILEVFSDCPLKLEGIISQCMERQPDARPPGFESIITELEGIIEEIEESEEATVVLSHKEVTRALDEEREDDAARIQEAVARIRDLVDLGDLTGASQALTSALAEFEDKSPFSQFQGEIQSLAAKRAAQERAEAIAAAQMEIGDLLSRGSLAEAASMLSRAVSQFEDSTAFASLQEELETLEAKKAQEERAEALAKAQSEIGELLSQGSLAEADAALQAARAKLQDPEAFASLQEELETLEAKKAEEERDEALAKAQSEIEDLLTRGSASEASSALSAAMAHFQDPAAFSSLQTRLQALEAKQAEEKRSAALAGAQREIQSFLSRGALDEASSSLSRARSELGDAPVLDTLAKELESHRARQAQQERDKAVERARGEIRKALSRGSLPEADAALKSALDQFQDPGAFESLGKKVEALRRRRAKVEKLISRGEKLVGSEEWEEAVRLLRQVGEDDPTLPRARKLLSQAEAGVAEKKRQEERSRALEAALSKVSGCLEKADFEAAGKALDQAHRELGPDPRFDELAAKLASARRGAEVERLVTEARARLESATPSGMDEAFKLAQEALRLDPDAKAPQDLVAKIETAQKKAAEEQRRRADKAVRQIRGLLRGDELDAAREAIARVERELGAAVDLAPVRGELEERQRRLQRDALRKKAEEKLAHGEWGAGLEAAQDALALDPQNDEIRALVARAQREIEERRRLQAVAREGEAIGALLDGGRLRRARRRLRAATETYGTVDPLPGLEQRLTELVEARPRLGMRWKITLAGAAVVLVAVLAWRFFPQGTPVVPPQGRLVVHAIPWARITAVVDGEGNSVDLDEEAFTPQVLTLAPGLYDVTLNYEGQERRVAVEVTSDGTRQETVVLEEVDLDDYFRRAGWPDSDGDG